MSDEPGERVTLNLSQDTKMSLFKVWLSCPTNPPGLKDRRNLENLIGISSDGMKFSQAVGFENKDIAGQFITRLLGALRGATASEGLTRAVQKSIAGEDLRHRRHLEYYGGSKKKGGGNDMVGAEGETHLSKKAHHFYQTCIDEIIKASAGQGIEFALAPERKGKGK